MTAGIAGGFGNTLTRRGAPDTQPVRREFLRRVIALDPVIDETIGESSQLRYHSPILQTAVDGFFAALWRPARPITGPIAEQPKTGTRLRDPAEHFRERLQPGPSEPAHWMADPVGTCRACETAVRRLHPTSRHAVPAAASDKTAEALVGLAQALNGWPCSLPNPPIPAPNAVPMRLRVPDWLPALVTAGRAFIVIGAVALFWIVTAWPGGNFAITIAAIAV